MVTKPDCRRKGYGLRLLQLMIKNAQHYFGDVHNDTNLITMSVQAKAQATLPLFKKLTALSNDTIDLKSISSSHVDMYVTWDPDNLYTPGDDAPC